MPTTEKLEKELFEMVYNWGKVGVVTDNECFAFKSTMQEIITQTLAEERERVRENLPKIITPTVEPPPNNLSQNQIFASGQMNMLLRVTDLLSSLDKLTDK